MDGKYIIPLIYKEYGRSRGCRDSAEAFAKYIEDIVNEESLNIRTQLIEVNDLVKYARNSHFKDRIIFNICFVQNPDQRLFYDLIKTPKDIVFCKEILDIKTDYIQDLKTVMWKDIPRHRYFPKYYSPVFNRNRGKRVYQDPNGKWIANINYCWYNRVDTSPYQTSVYEAYCNLLKINDYKVEAFGFKNDVSIGEIFKRNDVILYTAPDHLDPFPNTIFQALVNNLAVIEIVNPNTGKTDPGFQTLKETFSHKVYSEAEWNEYMENGFWDFGMYNNNENISNHRRFNEFTIGSLNYYLTPEEYAEKVLRLKTDETKYELKKRLLRI